MNAVVIEHVKVSELPENWRAKLHTASNARVTVRIEEEPSVQTNDNPLFGMWRDREDMADVEAHVRTQRAPRFKLDDS